MSQAKRELRFTARDVLDIVLNGESDVDINFTETDEESDEEAFGEESKENQPPSEPTDCPVHADIQLPQPAKHAQPRERYQWQKKNFISPNTDFSGPPLTEDVISLQTSLQYFRRFVSEDMIDSLTTNTNVYSLQTTGTSVNTSSKEIEQMLGMHLMMALVQMNGLRMYWEANTRHAPVADVMPRNRFQSLMTSLHLVDNVTVPEREKKDKLWKIRPWLNSFREKCLQVVPEEHNSVDEMMIDMSGVDLLDSFTAKYKFPLKTRRWYMYIFWHTISLAVINAWLLYKRDCEALKVPQKDILKLRLFQAELAASLILVNTEINTPKRVRPSSAQKRQLEDGPPIYNPRKAPCQPRPLPVRQDQVGHLPLKTQRGRCRNSGCSGYTNVLCHKCDIRLCLTGDKNCFWDYHC